MSKLVYESNLEPAITSSNILALIQRHQEPSSDIKILAFRNILKYCAAVPELVELLKQCGVWSSMPESAFQALVHCRVEKVFDFGCNPYSVDNNFFRLSSMCCLLVSGKQK